MHFRTFLAASAASIALSSALAAPAMAQEISSAVQGQITSDTGPVAGAKISVIHVPSGTTVNTVSGRDGNFSASGLRVGGPYTVKVSATGFVETSITEIQLDAGQPLTLPITISSAGEEIVVRASAVKGIVDASGGPLTVLNRKAIEGAASVTRDVRDLVRRDPMATIDPGQSRGVIIAGQNARLNKFSVDGVRFSDNFGLNVGGLPTARGPVPLDAIEQLSVKVAPYDIREGDFQGGAINVVLRSGTNSFTGDGFYTLNTDGLTGDTTRVTPSTPTGKIKLDYKSYTYGGFLSGPIIKDKLFFAIAYEYLHEGTPIQIGTAGFPSVVPNLTDAQIDQVSAVAKSVYNYDTLGVQRSTIETDKKFTAKLDWNIAPGHRMSVTYIKNDSANSSTAGFSSTSPTAPALGLGSNNYRRPEKVDSYVAQINSDWGDGLRTELRGNYRKYDLSPVPYGAIPFAQMRVCLDPNAVGTAANTNAINCAVSTPTLYFGPDQFRHFNYVRTKQYGAELTVSKKWGAFTGKLDAAWSHLDVANAFTQNAYGNYYFDSLADFQAGKASSLALGGSITGDLKDVLASFKYDQYTFGAQLAFDPSPRVNVTAGARIDMYGGTTPPPVNQYFLARYGFANNAISNGRMVFQPRLSASWKISPEVQVRGGIGLFAGGSPDVFLGNSYSVSGVYGNSITIQRNADGTCTLPTVAICNAALSGATGTNFSSLVTDYLRNNTGSLSLAAVNALDPKYKLPSTWKTNFSVDWTPHFEGFLGSGWDLGGDLYYGWTNNAPIYKDLRLVAIGTMPDGRARYASTTAGSNTDLFLTNTSQGHSLVAVARLDKSFDFGLSAGISYSFQDVTDVSSMNGTTASGTYGQNAMVDPNIAAYGTSIYQVRNSVKFHFDFDHAFFGDYKTRFSVFGEKRSGLPYSLTMNDPALSNSHSTVFGTAGSSNRYLLYVPDVSSQTADAKVVYDSAATYSAFANFVTTNGLKQGAIVGKNSARAPGWFKVDLHVDQDVPVPFQHIARIKLFADMENVLNLLNSNWGAIRQVSFPYLASVVNVSCATTAGSNCTQYRYSSFSNPAVNNLGKVSLWSVRFGVRLQF